MKSVVCCAILLLSLIVVATAAHAAPLSRPADPVVMKGADLPMFKGTAPDSLVAFHYEGGWVQIPIQVDERDVRSYGEIYDFLDHWSLDAAGVEGELYSFLEEFYTDPNTYMGPDTDPMLDDNDEVVFMARDTGDQVLEIADPPGVVPGSRAEVRVSDPLDGATGYVYLFQSAAGLDPSAGQSYVDYQFKLQSGDYLETFRLLGINLESSTASSEYYERTFTSRWLTEVLRITAPGASGVDILDRRKIRILASGGLCGQTGTEAGAEELEGAFVANKSGPVRGIRSHMGFRSGPGIQQDHFFYEQREDIVLHWRVHALESSAFVFVDYNPAAIGMTYFNNYYTDGVIIDGVPDSVIPGVLRWELVSGSPGSLAIIQDLVSNFSPNASGYYLDDDSPVPPQCLGDAFAIGSSGQSISGFIPDTDPRTSSNTLAWVSSRHYGPPGWSVADAEQLRAFSENPLVATLQGPETVLVANFMNGNTDFFRSRVYLWNPAVNAGNVSVRVFTLEQTGSSTLLGMVDLGSLGPRSALNIRLEDILDELMIPRPYETNNGNLTLEFTIGVQGVQGAAQVFNNSLTLAFGTYPLQGVPSTSAGSPTVLAANFLNGNTDFFRSRIYLFNPSASDGNVTVRVYTLPRTGDPAEELTNGPHPLGTLAARSGLNIRLEDILDELMISRPYETDSGNLLLEFTIGAADVIGAAQVFDNSLTLAFGTYPLQIIQ